MRCNCSRVCGSRPGWSMGVLSLIPTIAKDDGSAAVARPTPRQASSIVRAPPRPSPSRTDGPDLPPRAHSPPRGPEWNRRRRPAVRDVRLRLQCRRTRESRLSSLDHHIGEVKRHSLISRGINGSPVELGSVIYTICNDLHRYERRSSIQYNSSTV